MFTPNSSYQPPATPDDLLMQQFEFQRIEIGQSAGDDQQVAEGMLAALDWVERDTNRAILPTDRTVRVAACPRNVTLWPTPLIEATAVTYADRDGATQTLDPAAYRVVADQQPGRVEFRCGFNWPATADDPRPVTIHYRTGHADVATIPPTLLAAVRILASHLYENREASTVVQLHEVPMGVKRLLDLHRFVRVEGE